MGNDNKKRFIFSEIQTILILSILAGCVVNTAYDLLIWILT